MPQKSNKIIISCAVTGSIHTPTMSDALPITPDQIATQAIDAAQAGAAILHLHARDPEDGRPSPDPKIFMQFLPRIKQSCDAIVNITTGGAVTMTVEQRISAANQLSPEMCSLNMGSMNFALYPMARRYKTWKYDWEEPYLTQSDAYIFPNTFRDIEKVYRTLGEGHGVKFEHECYDTGHLYNLAHCIDRGLFKPPVFLQLIFGILGGIGPDLDNLLFMKRTADRLFGDDYLWSVLAGGRHQMNFCTVASMLGGNVRVGLEDSLYIGPGKLAASNAEQVAKIRRIVTELGFEAATPQEAREMLALKGASRVKFSPTMDFHYEIRSHQQRREARPVPRAMEPARHRRDERLPVQARPASGRLHLARSSGNGRSIPGYRGDAAYRLPGRACRRLGGRNVRRPERRRAQDLRRARSEAHAHRAARHPEPRSCGRHADGRKRCLDLSRRPADPADAAAGDSGTCIERPARADRPMRVMSDRTGCAFRRILIGKKALLVAGNECERFLAAPLFRYPGCFELSRACLRPLDCFVDHFRRR